MLALAGCSSFGGVSPVSVTLPQETAARSSSSAAVPPIIRGIDLPLGALSTSGDGFVDMAPLPVCEAAAVILGDSLSIPHSCSGGGVVGIVHPSSDPVSLLALFVATVERAGGTVAFRRGAAIVTGPASGEASGFAGDAPASLPAALPVEGLEAFTVPAGPAEFDETRELQTYSREGILRPIRGELDADNVALMVDQLGLDLRVVQVGGQRFVVGDSAALATFDAIGDIASASVVPVPAPGLSAEAVASIAGTFPAVAVTHDLAAGTVYLGGTAEDISSALASLRRLTPEDSRVRIEGAFFSYSTSDLRSLELSLSLGASGDLSTALLRVPFSVAVDQVSRSSFAQIVARPSVTGTLGVPATFRSGGSVPVLASVDPETGAETVEYRDVGLTTRFTVTPLLGSLLRLSVEVELSNVAGAGVLDNPSFDTRSVSTSVDLHRGDTVMLSGLAELERSGSRSRSFGIPGSAGSSSDKSLGLFVTLR